MSIAFEAARINCQMYSACNGKCKHRFATTFWGQRDCVLDGADPRITECAVRVAHVRPPPPAPPPRNPSGYQPAASGFGPSLQGGRPKPEGPPNTHLAASEESEYWDRAPGAD